MLKIILSLFVPISLFAQKEENWDVYLASYEKGVGSTLINMSAKPSAPYKAFPFVLITGVSFKNCNADGLPTPEQFEALYRIADSVKETIARSTESMAVGTFTYQCERLDYYYVKDTSAVRLKLKALYDKSFPAYQSYTNIKEDIAWDAYLNFLYPNEETQEYMSNQKVVSKLQEAGDNLNKPRQVDHWLYFKTMADRDCILPYLLKSKFKIEEKETIKQTDYPFKLHISRTDKVIVEHITQVSLELKKQAKKCNGDYDGWEAAVVK